MTMTSIMFVLCMQVGLVQSFRFVAVYRDALPRSPTSYLYIIVHLIVHLLQNARLMVSCKDNKAYSILSGDFLHVRYARGVIYKPHYLATERARATRS